MKKLIPIYLYGAVNILVGLFLIISERNTYKTVQLALGICLTIASIMAFIAALSRLRKQIQFAYHEMHALAMLVFGVSILLFADTIEIMISYTSFLFIFYAISEIIFCNWLFNLHLAIIYKIIIVRFILGLLIGLGTLIAMNYTKITLEIFGILFIMVGLNIMLYVPVMKGEALRENNIIP